MTLPYSAQIRLSFEDYIAFSDAFSRLTLARRLARASHLVIVTLMFLAAVLLWIRGEWGLAIYFFGLAVLLLALRFIAEPWLRHRQFRNQRLDEHEIAFQADDEGFTTSTPVASGSHKWAAVRRIDDLPDIVVLWPNNRLGFMIPKRAFSTPAQAESFARFAKEKTAGQTL